MNGVLQFAIGAETGGFAHGISEARAKLSEFLKTATEVVGITGLIAAGFAAVKESANLVKGVMEQIEAGAALEHLSKRTQTSVKDLFLLQKGFAAVGLESSEVGGMIFKLQKSLSGISESGESTGGIFAALGIVLQALRNSDPVAQFQVIGEALSKLNANQAAGIAGKIFGREGAANMIQLAHSAEEFGAAMDRSAGAAAMMERNAASFQKIEMTINQIKGKGNALFLGIAQGAAPGIQAAMDAINKIDLAGLGKRIGDVIGSIGQTIKDQKLGELLSLSLNAGVEAFGNYFMAVLAGIKAALVGTFTGPNLTALEAGFAAYGDEQALKMYKNPETRKWLEKDRQQKLARAQELMGPGPLALFQNAFKGSLGSADSSIGKDLAKFLATEHGRIAGPGSPGFSAGASGGSMAAIVAKLEGITAATSAEKMGFIFGHGGPSVLQDHARRTADNTSKIVAILGPAVVNHKRNWTPNYSVNE